WTFDRQRGAHVGPPLPRLSTPRATPSGYGKNEHKMGWKSQPTRVVFFHDIRAPSSHLLGEEGEGLKTPCAASTAGASTSPPATSGRRKECSTQRSATCTSGANSGALADLQALQFKLAD